MVSQLLLDLEKITCNCRVLQKIVYYNARLLD